MKKKGKRYSTVLQKCRFLPYRSTVGERLVLDFNERPGDRLNSMAADHGKDDTTLNEPEPALEGPSLQQRFEAMRARKQAAAARVKAAEKARANGPRSAAEKAALREKFIAQARHYIGTPYSDKRNPEVDAINSENGAATLFLDCCGLVRRVLLDLKEEFGFEIGPWNQSYLHDTLPDQISEYAVAEGQPTPGDLIFWSATYDNPDKAPNKHDLVHVEIFVGGETGEATIGSRFEGPGLETPGVYAFDSYKSFGGHNAHGHQLIFRPIDAWLDGICVSHCKTCSWCEPAPKKGAAKKSKCSKVFAPSAAKVNTERTVPLSVGNGVELAVRCS